MGESSAPPPRIFTLDEASALLPTLQRLLVDLQSARATLSDAQQRMAQEVVARSRANGHGGRDQRTEELATSVREARSRITRSARAIAELGCELKDPERGMVDFRTMREGRVVYLCWLLEEPRIMYWHELRGGYLGRQPL